MGARDSKNNFGQTSVIFLTEVVMPLTINHFNSFSYCSKNYVNSNTPFHFESLFIACLNSHFKARLKQAIVLINYPSI